MSSVDSILDSKSEAYYDPAADFSGVMPEGTYKAYATELTLKEDLVVRSKYLADVYEVTFEIADENSEYSYDRDGKTVSGKAFVGKKLRSKGFFRFKKPNPDTYPNLEENSGSNKSYMELVESFGVELEEDKEGRFFLPSVDESDIVGVPVIIDVYHSKWTDNDGNERTTPRAGSIFKWDGQKRRLKDFPF
jgi:hypothetical protein